MLAGILLGGLLGKLIPDVMMATGFVGEFFVNSLTILVIGLVLASMVVGITALGDYRKLGYAGMRAIVYYCATGVVAVVIGLVMALAIKPGQGVHVPLALESMSDTLAMPERFGFYAGFVIFVVLFGGVLTTMGIKGRPVVTFFKGVHETLFKLVNVMFYVAPVGLLFVVGAAVAKGDTDFGSIWTVAGRYPLVALAALLIYVVVVMPLVLRLMGQQDVVAYYRNLAPAFLTAFGTGSSTSALPFTYQAVVEKSKVDQRAGSLVLPLGNILNFGPTAMVLIIAAIFGLQATGTQLTTLTLVALVLAATVLSIGLAGAPLVIGPLLLLVFTLSGAPASVLATVGIVILVDWLVDRMRSTANVCSDAVGAAVVSQAFEFQTATRTVRREPTTRIPRTTRQGTRTRSSGPDARRGRPGKDHAGRADGRSTRATREKPPVRKTAADRKPARKRADAKEPSPFAMSSESAPALDVVPQESKPQGRSRKPAVRKSDDSGDHAPTRQQTRPSTPAAKQTDDEGESRTRRPRKTASRRTGSRTTSRRGAARGAEKPVVEQTGPEHDESGTAAATEKRVSRRRNDRHRTPETAEKGHATRDETPEVTNLSPVASDTDVETPSYDKKLTGSPSRAKIEEELSRVTAQLKSMDVPETPVEPQVPEVEVAKAPEPKAPEVEVAKPVVAKPEERISHVDQPEPEEPVAKPVLPTVEKAPEVAEEKPVAEPVLPTVEKAPEIVEEEPVTRPAADEPSDEEKEVAAAFGRARRHRPRPAHREKTEPEHAPAADVPDSDSSSESSASPIDGAPATKAAISDTPPEKVTFGRSKRKRTR